MANPFEQDAIRFYTTKDENGYMSNFARFQVECFGRTWMTSEHAYQAQKYLGTDDASYEEVANAPHPGAAAAVGRDPNRKIRPEWNSVRDDVMRFIVMHKFTQNAKIKEKLLATGDRPLFEFDTHRGDQYWAIDQNGNGKNMLGVILMEVREVLKEHIKEYDDFLKAREECRDCVVTKHGSSTITKPCEKHDVFIGSNPIDSYLLSLRF